MIWIIAGTSEGREIIDRIKDLDSYIATVATDEGKQFIASEKIIAGRMDYDQMEEFSIKNKVSLIVDLSHPYAEIVSANVKRLAENQKIKYIRYIREKADKSANGVYLKSYEEAYQYLSHIKGTVFFTTGSKHIGEFEKIRQDNRFIYRVLPALESIQICHDHHIPIRNIVAGVGPFSRDYNKIMFETYQAGYVVMKDSGAKGGTLEKIEACEELEIIPVIIGRQDEEGIRSLDEVEALIRKHT